MKFAMNIPMVPVPFGYVLSYCQHSNIVGFVYLCGGNNTVAIHCMILKCCVAVWLREICKFIKYFYGVGGDKNEKWWHGSQAKYFDMIITSSIGFTAHSGLWPVKQCPSIFSYLPLILSIFSLSALEDLFLLLSILSWVFPSVSSTPVLEWRSL